MTIEETKKQIQDLSDKLSTLACKCEDELNTLDEKEGDLTEKQQESHDFFEQAYNEIDNAVNNLAELI